MAAVSSNVRFCPIMHDGAMFHAVMNPEDFYSKTLWTKKNAVRGKVRDWFHMRAETSTVDKAQMFLQRLLRLAGCQVPTWTRMWLHEGMLNVFLFFRSNSDGVFSLTQPFFSPMYYITQNFGIFRQKPSKSVLIEPNF